MKLDLLVAEGDSDEFTEMIMVEYGKAESYLTGYGECEEGEFTKGFSGIYRKR